MLTTVLGGLLGFFFQNRSWEHQHQIQQADEERPCSNLTKEGKPVTSDLPATL